MLGIGGPLTVSSCGVGHARTYILVTDLIPSDFRLFFFLPLRRILAVPVSIRPRHT